MISQYYLFRLLLVSKSSKCTLFPQVPSEILKKILLARPSGLVRVNIHWAIANSREENDSITYFKFGRAIKKPSEVYDLAERAFVPAELDVANSADCYFDSATQVLAIEKAPECPLPSTLAKYIRSVIQSYIELGDPSVFSPEEIAYLKSRECGLRAITDPFDFIADILSAKKIFECKLYGSRLNPFDYDALFQKPTGRIIELSNATDGYTVIKSAQGLLEKDFIKDMARASAAAGNDASAKIQRGEGGLTERIYLRKTDAAARVEIEIDGNESVLKTLIRIMRDKYHQIRGSLG